MTPGRILAAALAVGGCAQVPGLAGAMYAPAVAYQPPPPVYYQPPPPARGPYPGYYEIPYCQRPGVFDPARCPPPAPVQAAPAAFTPAPAAASAAEPEAPEADPFPEYAGPPPDAAPAVSEAAPPPAPEEKPPAAVDPPTTPEPPKKTAAQLRAEHERAVAAATERKAKAEEARQKREEARAKRAEERKADQAAAEAADEVICGKAPERSAWDGIYIGLESAFKRVANDPGSVDFDQCAPLQRRSAPTCWTTKCSVRAKNGFGALVLQVLKFSKNAGGWSSD